MIPYLDNFFMNLKIKKENAYFGYIFPLFNENKSNFQTMIKYVKKIILLIHIFMINKIKY